VDTCGDSTMSIVTLKRKTQTQYHNLSVGQHQFSLNGGHRSQGFVGQTSLSRSLPRTLMVGNVARGSGGFRGGYHMTPVVTEGTGLGNNRLNQPGVIKSSVLDTNGQLMTQYRWIRRPAPFTSVKPDATLNLQTQQQYIDVLRRVTLTNQCSVDGGVGMGVGVKSGCGGVCGPTRAQYLNYNSVAQQHRVSKPPVVMTQGEYILGVLDGECAKTDTGSQLAGLLQKNYNSKPFACTNIPYVTPQQLPTGASRAKTATVVVYIP